MYKVGTYTIKITRVDKNCNQRQWTNSRSVSAHTTSKNEHTKHAIIKSREVSLCIFLYSKIDGDMCTVCLMKKFSKKKSTYSAHISINFGTQQKNTETPLYTVLVNCFICWFLDDVCAPKLLDFLHCLWLQRLSPLELLVLYAPTLHTSK